MGHRTNCEDFRTTHMIEIHEIWLKMLSTVYAGLTLLGKVYELSVSFSNLCYLSFVRSFSRSIVFSVAKLHARLAIRLPRSPALVSVREVTYLLSLFAVFTELGIHGNIDGDKS